MALSPDRLRSWIKKRKQGATRLVLAHEQGLGVRATVACWQREDIEASEDPSRGGSDVVAEVMDAAQDHTDGVNAGKCTFLLSWQTEGERILNSMPLYLEPSEAVATTTNASETISTQALIGQLLGHIHDQQKVINGSLGVVLGGQKGTIEILQAQITFMGQQQLATLAALAEARALPARVDLTPEDLESKRLTHEALRKLIDLGPMVGALAVRAAARYFKIDLDGEDDSPPSQANGATTHDA